jgi:hypothetical protein
MYHNLIVVFCVVTQCSLAGGYQRFGGREEVAVPCSLEKLVPMYYKSKRCTENMKNYVHHNYISL